jgi:hypothetical protein
MARVAARWTWLNSFSASAITVARGVSDLMAADCRHLFKRHVISAPSTRPSWTKPSEATPINLQTRGLAVEAKRAATISRVCATDLFGFPQRFARSAGVKDD